MLRKRILSIFLALTMVISSLTIVHAETSNWYDEALNYLVDAKVISEDFNSEGVMSRGLLAEWLVAGGGVEALGRNSANPFAELSPAHPNYNAILTLYYAGYFAGQTNAQGQLIANADGALTREQGIVFLARVFGIPNSTNNVYIPDLASIAPYAQAYVQKAMNAGVISGMDGNNTFGPTLALTKQQFASMLQRSMIRATENGTLKVNSDGTVKNTGGEISTSKNTTSTGVSRGSSNSWSGGSSTTTSTAFGTINVRAVATNAIKVTLSTDISGVTIAVAGMTISGTPSYNASEKTYTVTFTTSMVSNREYNVTVSKSGYTTKTTPFTYTVTNSMLIKAVITANASNIVAALNTAIGSTSGSLDYAIAANAADYVSIIAYAVADSGNLGTALNAFATSASATNNEILAALDEIQYLVAVVNAYAAVDAVLAAGSSTLVGKLAIIASYASAVSGDIDYPVVANASAYEAALAALLLDSSSELYLYVDDDPSYNIFLALNELYDMVLDANVSAEISKTIIASATEIVPLLNTFNILSGATAGDPWYAASDNAAAYVAAIATAVGDSGSDLYAFDNAATPTSGEIHDAFEELMDIFVFVNASVKLDAVLAVTTINTSGGTTTIKTVAEFKVMLDALYIKNVVLANTETYFDGIAAKKSTPGSDIAAYIAAPSNLTIWDAIVEIKGIVDTTNGPTADVTFYTKADGTTPTTLDDSDGDSNMTPTITVDNGVAAVIVLMNNTLAQTIAVDGADAADVTLGTAQANQVFTVNTSSVATAGGDKTFTIIVSEYGKTDIEYDITVTVEEPVEEPEEAIVDMTSATAQINIGSETAIASMVIGTASTWVVTIDYTISTGDILFTAAGIAKIAALPAGNCDITIVAGGLNYVGTITVASAPSITADFTAANKITTTPSNTDTYISVTDDQEAETLTAAAGVLTVETAGVVQGDTKTGLIYKVEADKLYKAVTVTAWDFTVIDSISTAMTADTNLADGNTMANTDVVATAIANAGAVTTVSGATDSGDWDSNDIATATTVYTADTGYTFTGGSWDTSSFTLTSVSGNAVGTVTSVIVSTDSTMGDTLTVVVTFTVV